MLRSPQEAVTRAPESVVDYTELDDGELLAHMGDGDELAFAQLFQRHVDAVRSYALRTYANALDPDDLAAEAFFRVLQAVRRGSARIEHPRAYLLTVTRRVAMEWTARHRDVPVTDEELSSRVEAASDRSTSSVERHLIARAFANLPERWRNVLWRVEVEGERPSAVGGHLGLSANATAALARRARDGLRAAYLQAHLSDARGPVDCRSVVDKLGAFTTGSVRGSERRRIVHHLEECDSCAALHAELADVCAGLRAHASYVGPLVGLGTAVAGKTAAGSVLGFGGKLALLTGRMKAAFTASAVVGVGAFGLVASGMLHGPVVESAPDYTGGRGDQVLPVCTTCTPGTKGPVPSPTPTKHAPPNNVQAPVPHIPHQRSTEQNTQRTAEYAGHNRSSPDRADTGNTQENRDQPAGHHQQQQEKPPHSATVESDKGGPHLQSSHVPDSTLPGHPGTPDPDNSTFTSTSRGEPTHSSSGSSESSDSTRSSEYSYSNSSTDSSSESYSSRSYRSHSYSGDSTDPEPTRSLGETLLGKHSDSAPSSERKGLLNHVVVVVISLP
ncbi:sigma-70 family RNA polymerase sigma factor [Sciscionella sediminilitoris]|uniref:sigma-70 family RNA polymerase sigma factor n=1 Tax=Sciscionella sediminilitoris TaxID=1445613 RepID=UPI00068C0549|nr:sigma-70 family RNA polymerase sigma factor [Sciscionella sp. SE31]